MVKLYDEQKPLMTSAEILLGSKEAARKLGLSLQDSYKASGLSEAQVETGEGYFALHEVVSFLNYSAKISASESFTLAIARHQPPLRFAMTGQLVRFAANLGEAIHASIRFSILNSQYSLWRVTNDAQTTKLQRETRVHLDQDTSQLQILALALTYKAMNALCQQRIPLKEVRFNGAKTCDHDELQQYFGAPIFYEEPTTSLIFENQMLGLPIPTQNKQVYNILWNHLDSLTKNDSAALDLVERLRSELRNSMGSRRCSLEGVCYSWNMHPRSLQRSLRNLGTGFREQLLEVRMEFAKAYLRDSSISVLDLSELLGYRNSSAFSRAFKQQSGYSPDNWRNDPILQQQLSLNDKQIVAL